MKVGSNLVTITHSAIDNSYSVSLPAYGAGKLLYDGGGGSYHNGEWQSYTSSTYKLVDAGVTKPVLVTLSYPPHEKLSYTSSGSWFSTGTQGSRRTGLFVYGIPTVPGTMPITGTASYLATVEGFTRTMNGVWGTADFQFDFGAGTLAGEMSLTSSDGWDPVDLGKFSFRDTVYSKGSTTFGGRLTVPTSTELGSFSGQFNGPGGAELMGTFQTPAWHPFFKRWEEISGIFKGKRK